MKPFRFNFVVPGRAARSSEEREAAVAQLCARFAAEARSHGISIEELIQRINQPQSHV